MKMETKDYLKQVANDRIRIAKIKAEIKYRQAILEQSQEYKDLQARREALKVLESSTDTVIGGIKEHEEKEFSLTGKKNTHPIEGVQIKKFSVVRILNEKKAIKWAGENAPSVLSLKKAPFNKIAKAMELEFVEIYSEYRAQIASDLSMYEGEEND